MSQASTLPCQTQRTVVSSSKRGASFPSLWAALGSEPSENEPSEDASRRWAGRPLPRYLRLAVEGEGSKMRCFIGGFERKVSALALEVWNST